MGRLEIIGFAKLPKDNATYSEKKEYVEKSAKEIEKILRDLGLREEEDYSKEITVAPILRVYIYLYKADKNLRLFLYLNTKRFLIEFEYDYLFNYLIIEFDNNGRIWIHGCEYLAILTNYFHSIRNFIEKIFKYLEECYQNGSVDLKDFTKFFLKNCRNSVEEGKKELDKVKEVLNRNKEIIKEKIGNLDIRDFRDLVIDKEGYIDIDSQKKVFILKYLKRYDDEVHITLSKIERLLKYGKFKEGLDEIPFVRRLKEIKQKLEKGGILYLYDICSRRGLIIPIDEKLKFVSYEKIDLYFGKIEEKEIEYSYFNTEEGKKKTEKIKVYIYDIDKLITPKNGIPLSEIFEKIPELEETEQVEKEEIQTTTFIKKPIISLDDFLKQMELLEKFNLFYDITILKKFYYSINSGNKFVILSGPTGTGKTLLGMIYAYIKSQNQGAFQVKNLPDFSQLVNVSYNESELKEGLMKNPYLCFVRVQPNWVSPKDIIGYYNPFSDNFVEGQIFNFLMNASQDKNNNYFLILDEMNLSHPEWYLSDIISAMETGGAIYIYIHNNNNIKIPYPKNLFIIGTINLDETTKELSPRLKSRAFYIEMRANFENYISKCNNNKEKEIAQILKVIDENLKTIGLGLGYRDIKHIKEYVENGGEISDALIAKIIPRIRTTDEEIKNVVDKIIKGLDSNNLGLTEFKNEDFEEFKKELENLKRKFEKYGYI
jgi:energy-coupling factor transporter ATP-binding protein EcfA2